MRLRSLELQGFKSFPDRIKIQFGDGITAVVGPNGSGKSNISDAVRWVLGEQSNKSLRGASREDVIFNGTASRKPHGFAEVTLTIDNTDRRLPFDGDLVAVSRRYFRSGVSEYLINKAAVRLSDVRNLFMDTGLGRDGYSMIGQGKISGVVECRPEERREMFEEAAGIAKFRHRKRDAERELDRADEQLVRVLDILTGLEERVGPLKIQKEKAEEFLALAAQKRDLEIGLWLNALEKSTDALKEQEDKIIKASAQQSDIEDELTKTAAQIEAFFTETNQLTIRIDGLRHEILQYESEAAQKDNDAVVCMSDIRHNMENIERISGEIRQSDSSHQSLQTEFEQFENAIDADNKRIGQRRLELEQCTGELEQLTEGMSESSGKLEAVNRELSRISSAISEAHVTDIAAQSSIQEIKARQSVIYQNIETQSAHRRELEKALDEVKMKMSGAEDQCTSLANSLKGYELRYMHKKEKLETCKKEADELGLQAEETLRRARLLEEMERNMEGFNASVKVVLKENKRGNLKGIHGAVSRLIRVPDEYSTAIETALGAAIQNIVVDTEQDAKQAIRMLQRLKGGRATFLPISSIRGTLLHENGLEELVGFIGIASALIYYDPQYETVIRSLLGRVVIAENMDSAVNIARQYGYRFRVVTLDGQVVNTGGSLTGGSLVKYAGVLGRANEIERLHSLAQEKKNLASEAAERYMQAEKDAAAAEADILGVQGELSCVQEERIRLEAECRRISEQKQDASESERQLREEQKLSEQRLGELENVSRRAQAQVKALQDDLKTQEDILGALTGDQKELILMRENIIERMNGIRMDILSDEKDMQSHQIMIEDIKARMNDSERLGERLTAQKKDLELHNIEIESKIEELKKEALSLRHKVEECNNDIEQLSQQRMAKEKQHAQLREQERTKAQERDLIGRELTRLEEQRLALQKDYDDIIARLWDEYELTRSEAQALPIVITDTAESGRILASIKGKIKALGSVNVSAIEEYEEVSAQYELMKVQVDDIRDSRDRIRKHIGELTVQMREIFIDRFKLINRGFSDIFREMFGGGEARLELTQADDVLESGIDILAWPPDKKVSLLSLSGGEKTLIALTLYFAIMNVNPPPFCILDEVEAALDDVNVDRFAQFLRRMSEKTQFIAITHRRGTMEEADMLYGVTMQEKGVTKILQLNMAEIERNMNLS